jgi:acyl carrier protein phosphodiesterase
MNFLAHLYLSGNFDELMIGNFMADFVKGKPALTIHPQVIKGIELHRQIDYYTDTHLVVKESKERLRAKYRKYAGVIVDMYYDHFLAANWRAYSELSLTDFASQTYQLLNLKKQLLPPTMHMLLHYMQKQNWLVAYARTEGIARALQGMSERTTFQSDMERAVFDLRQDYQLYQAEFTRYFPQLIQHVKEWKNIHL